VELQSVRKKTDFDNCRGTVPGDTDLGYWMCASIFVMILQQNNALFLKLFCSGYFPAARRAGVQVYEFAIGFALSPTVVTLFHHRKTALTLWLFPLVGFVSSSVESDDYGWWFVFISQVLIGIFFCCTLRAGKTFKVIMVV